MSFKPSNIDDYLAHVSEDKRAAIEKLRQTISAAAPGAEECISYQLPAFRLNGKVLVAFGASAKHCALYPMSPTGSNQGDIPNSRSKQGNSGSFTA